MRRSPRRLSSAEPVTTTTSPSCGPAFRTVIQGSLGPSFSQSVPSPGTVNLPDLNTDVNAPSAPAFMAASLCSIPYRTAFRRPCDQDGPALLSELQRSWPSRAQTRAASEMLRVLLLALLAEPTAVRLNDDELIVLEPLDEGPHLALSQPSDGAEPAPADLPGAPYCDERLEDVDLCEDGAWSPVVGVEDLAENLQRPSVRSFATRDIFLFCAEDVAKARCMPGHRLEL